MKYHPKESIYKLVAEQNSKSQVNKIIKAVADEEVQFDELAGIFLGEDPELARRAAWAIGYIAVKNPSLVSKWLPKMIRNLSKENQHPAIYRNTFRFLEVIEIPRKHAALVLDVAYKFILNGAQPVAIRAFAMSTAMNVVRNYPELAPELKAVVIQVMEEESPAIRSRGKRIMAEISK